MVSVLMGIVEGVRQFFDERYIHAVAWEIVHKAHASDPRSRVIALRDYLRQHVSFQGAPYDNHPLLRASAAETLRSGLGYCGEVTRAFIAMAAAVGLRAQRMYLWGTSPHVVAEAELAPGDTVIVDSQNPPQIVDLEPLDHVILRHEYDDYYTLNVRRLRISWLVSRIKHTPGPLTYWMENPHALKAFLWFLLAMALPSMIGGRILVRFLLRKYGWIHITERLHDDKPNSRQEARPLYS